MPMDFPGNKAGYGTTYPADDGLRLVFGAELTVPPGTYGTFTANGGSDFVFGVAGTSTPTVYNLQNLNLNGQCRLDIVGPVILTMANGFTANGMVGTTNHSSWLQLQIASAA